MRVTSTDNREVAGSSPVIFPNRKSKEDVVQLVERLRTLFDFPLLFNPYGKMFESFCLED